MKVNKKVLNELMQAFKCHSWKKGVHWFLRDLQFHKKLNNDVLYLSNRSLFNEYVDRVLHSEKNAFIVTSQYDINGKIAESVKERRGKGGAVYVFDKKYINNAKIPIEILLTSLHEIVNNIFLENGMYCSSQELEEITGSLADSLRGVGEFNDKGYSFLRDCDKVMMPHVAKTISENTPVFNFNEKHSLLIMNFHEKTKEKTTILKSLYNYILSIYVISFSRKQKRLNPLYIFLENFTLKSRMGFDLEIQNLGLYVHEYISYKNYLRNKEVVYSAINRICGQSSK